jgi:hypothetical protein
MVYFSMPQDGDSTANKRAVLRFFLVALFLVPGVAPLFGVTLQQLSIDDLAVRSTAIVRGHVVDSYTLMNGGTVYTHYHVTVAESLKGATVSTVDVAVPGGTASGVRQVFPGVPQLTVGSDYLLYLWTSPDTGITLPAGFTQGIYQVSGPATSLILSRSASGEMMLNAKGRQVRDQAVSMGLSDMRARVASALAKSGSSK